MPASPQIPEPHRKKHVDQHKAYKQDEEQYKPRQHSEEPNQKRSRKDQCSCKRKPGFPLRRLNLALGKVKHRPGQQTDVDDEPDGKENVMRLCYRHVQYHR